MALRERRPEWPKPKAKPPLKPSWPNGALPPVFAAGKEFLLPRNAKRAEVEVLPSGLQYEVLVAAEGSTPSADSQVTTHYEGRLIDDTVFDSSISRGSPASFRLNQVIAGWTEALQLMSPGAKWRLFIPSELAYGERGAGQLIGPHATLVFDVELISIDDYLELDSGDKLKRAEAIRERLQRAPARRRVRSHARLTRTILLGTVAVALAIAWLADAYEVETETC